MCIQNCVELSIELCRTRNWGFQSIRELYTEPRKPGGWEAIPLPAIPCGGLWLVDSIRDSDSCLPSSVFLSDKRGGTSHTGA